MAWGTALIARPRLGAALLNSVSRTALAALTVGLGLGVVLPGEARAGCNVMGVYNSTFNLSCSSTTFLSGNVINTVSAYGVYGGPSPSWTVDNYGSIQGASAGIYLTSQNSTVTNHGGGTITGSNSVVDKDSGATVNNSGHIYGTGAYLNGVWLKQGGTVHNYSGAIIGGGYPETKNGGGVAIYGGAGTVTNAGSILSYGRRAAIYLAEGGMVTNSGMISSEDNGYDAVHIHGGAGTATVTNETGGTISGGVNGDGVQLDNGGTVTNRSMATISGGDAGVEIDSAVGRVNNFGNIYGTGLNGDGVSLRAGGTVNNYVGAKIGGAKVTGGKSFGVVVEGGAGTVTNAGLIQSYETHSAISLNAGGSVINSGMISGGGDGIYIVGGRAVTNVVTNKGTITGGVDGIVLDSGGTVNNYLGAKIHAPNIGVYVTGGLGTVTNAGSIQSYGTHSAVSLHAGGSVSNSGVIVGGGDGVYITGGPGTVTNAGTIGGGGTASVQFAGTGANVLTLQTGSTLTGNAIGSTASGATNALILQGQGTANNNFVNFNTLNAEGSGTWTLGGSSTFGDSMVTSGTLSVTGTLNSSTLEIDPGAAFIDTGAVTVTGSVTNAGALTINGVPMNVVGAGGTFTQTGGSTTLLNGGVLDPPNVNVGGGVFGGSGGVVGDVSVTGGEIKPGAAPGGSLTVDGDYSQTGGEIVFDIDPNGMGGFLETTLDLDPSDSISISDTTFVFDFLNYTTATQFIADGLFNLNAFLGLAGGGEFCTELNCATVLQDVSFSGHYLIASGFDPATGAITAQAVPEPSTWALLITGFLGLGGLGLRRRKHV